MDQFEKMLNENYNNIRNYAMKLYYNIEDIEDIVQDSILKFIENDYISRYDPSKSSLVTYFFNYLKMCALSQDKNIKRKKKKINIISNSYMVDGEYVDIFDIVADEPYNEDEFNLNMEDIKKKVILIINEKPSYKLNYDMLMDFINGLSYKEICTKYNVEMFKVKNGIRNMKIMLKEFKPKDTRTYYEKNKKKAKQYQNEYSKKLKKVD